MFETCCRCGYKFEIPRDALDPIERLCEKCKEIIEGDPDNKARLHFEGGEAFEVTESEARRMLRFQQLIDLGYMPKEAMAKVRAELGEFEK